MPAVLIRSAGWTALFLILALASYGILKPRGLQLDFANFYDAGSKARIGAFDSLYDPFASIDGQPPFGNMSFVSAPITSYLYVPLAMLPPRTASLLFKLAGTLAQGLGLVLLYRQARTLAGPTEDDQGWFFTLFCGAALLFQPFWMIYSVGGQTTPFVFLLLVLGYRAYLRNRLVAVAILLSIVVVIKPGFAPAAVLLFIMSPMPFRLTALACALVAGGLSLALLGLPLHQDFLARVLSETSSLSAPWQNSNPFSWIEPLFVAPQAYEAPGELPASARALVTVLRLIGGGVLIWGMIRHLRSGIAPVAARHCVYVTALALVILLSPVVWAHYLTVLFIPLATLIALRRHLPGPALAGFGLGVGAAVFQSLIVIRRLIQALGLDSTPKIVAIGLLKSLTALLILSVLALAYRSIGRALRDPAWNSL